MQTHRTAKAFFVALTLFSAAVRAEETKPRKPYVCASFEVFEGRSGRLAVCHDTKKPRTFTSFTTVSVDTPEGKRAYLLGF